MLPAAESRLPGTLGGGTLLRYEFVGIQYLRATPGDFMMRRMGVFFAGLIELRIPTKAAWCVPALSFAIMLRGIPLIGTGYGESPRFFLESILPATCAVAAIVSLHVSGAQTSFAAAALFGCFPIAVCLVMALLNDRYIELPMHNGVSRWYRSRRVAFNPT